MSRHLKYLFLSIVLLLVQAKTMTLLTLEGITPDLLVIWVVILALKEGQLTAMPWGFGIGLAFDLITGNFLGLSALTKTVAAFTAGYFFDVITNGFGAMPDYAAQIPVQDRWAIVAYLRALRR